MMRTFLCCDERRMRKLKLEFNRKSHRDLFVVIKYYFFVNIYLYVHLS